MTTSLMRGVDRYAGIPLCLCTGLYLRFFRKHARGAMPPKSILVIKFFGLGSILLSTPFITALREKYPAARITYLSFAANRELIARIPEVSTSVSISTSSPAAFFATTVSAVRVIRHLHIDAVYDLEFFSKFSTLVSALSGARERSGFFLPTRWRRWNLTSSAPLDHTRHVTSGFLRQLRDAEGDITPPPPVLPLAPTAEERASMRKKLRFSGGLTTAVCMNINAGQTSLDRRWNPDRFAEVAARLTDRSDSTRVFLTGSAQEHPYVEDLLRRHPELRPRVHNCAGLLSLGELIALLDLSALLISNDSAPAHIASAVGTPAIVLFGPESPRFYGPLSSTKTLYKALPCSPCLNVYAAKMFSCPINTRCMSEISVDDVMGAVDEMFLPEEQSHAAIHETAQ